MVGTNFNRQCTLLTAAMLSGLAAVVAGAAHRFVPAWQPGYLVVASFLVALEASFVQHHVRRERMWLTDLARYLIPELTIMCLMMRIAATISTGPNPIRDDLRRWLNDPLSILDPPLLGFLLVGITIGTLAHLTMRDLSELAPHPGETTLPHTEAHQRDIALATIDRTETLQRIGKRHLIIGIVLLCALALETINLPHITGPHRATSLLSSSGAIIYLASALLLYSQARLTLLHTRWHLDGIPVAPHVARRWTSTSRLLVTIVVIAAAGIPRTDGLGLHGTFRTLLGIVGYLIAVGGSIVIWLLALIMVIPTWLFSLFTTHSPPLPPPPIDPIAPPSLPASHEPRLFAALIFWTCMLMLISHASGIFLQRHPGLSHTLRRLIANTHWLRPLRLLQRTARAWAAIIHPSTAAQHRTRITKHHPPSRLHHPEPRDLIRHFYLTTLKRAAAYGLARSPSQTPREYSNTLATCLPDIEHDIATLTDTFVIAHYSLQPMTHDNAHQTRRIWKRLQRRLHPTSHHQTSTTNEE